MSRYFELMAIFIIGLILTVALGCGGVDEEAGKRSFKFTYSMKISDIPVNSRSVLVYFPIPQSDAHQGVTDVNIESPFPYSFLSDNEYGNKIAKIEASDISGEEFEIKLSFRADRNNVSALGGSQKGFDTPSSRMRTRLLSPDRLVPLNGPVLKACKEVLRNGQTDLEKARAIYDYVVSTMAYDKSGTGWGRGDVLYACDARTGNCTDFHSLFVAMARASGIPARFVMGFPVPKLEKGGEIGGYHCWAEFFTSDLGWVPVDASEANKHPEMREFYFGNLDNNRVAFTIGRDLVFDENNISEPRNYLIYPLVVIDGEIFADYEMNFEYSQIM